MWFVCKLAWFMLRVCSFQNVNFHLWLVQFLPSNKGKFSLYYSRLITWKNSLLCFAEIFINESLGKRKFYRYPWRMLVTVLVKEWWTRIEYIFFFHKQNFLRGAIIFHKLILSFIKNFYRFVLKIRQLLQLLNMWPCNETLHL